MEWKLYRLGAGLLFSQVCIRTLAKFSSFSIPLPGFIMSGGFPLTVGSIFVTTVFKRKGNKDRFARILTRTVFSHPLYLSLKAANT